MRFLEANINILIFGIIIFILIALTVSIGIFYRYRKGTTTNDNNLNNIEQIEVNKDLLQNDLVKATNGKKKINREISSVSENLGNLIEKKNIFHTKNSGEKKEIDNPITTGLIQEQEE